MHEESTELDVTLQAKVDCRNVYGAFYDRSTLAWYVVVGLQSSSPSRFPRTSLSSVVAGP